MSHTTFELKVTGRKLAESTWPAATLVELEDVEGYLLIGDENDIIGIYENKPAAREGYMQYLEDAAS